ncbi:MAG: hypothetical protein ACM3ML_32140 [Micromonosporaceae bacterium]
MTGSTLAHIIIPIAVTLALAAWIAVLFYADRYPYWAGQNPAAQRERSHRRLTFGHMPFRHGRFRHRPVH